MKLLNKHIAVLGGASGLGFGVARLALAEGASNVTLIGRSEQKLKAAKAELGDRAKTVSLDIADHDAAQAAYPDLGSIDHVVITAAALTFAPVNEIPLKEVDAMIGTKIRGPFLAARILKDQMSSDGSFTFFSGLAAYRPQPGTVMVATVNAAIEGLAKALAVELAPLRFNVVSPGVVDTPTWDFLPDAERAALFGQMQRELPTRYVGTPHDLAEAALTLMTNRYITGTVLHVDGGGRVA